MSTFLEIWGKAWPIILAVAFFGVIIISHELGHFSVARLFKIKINEFSIGMGPAIFKKKGKQTLYSLRALPIGGYVSMEGEDEESTDENAFCNKPVWQRFLVVLAGATVNLILGALLTALLISQQNLVGTNVIHSFEEGSQLQASGLMAGDEIYKINGRLVLSDADLSYLMFARGEESIDVVVKRNGEKITINDVKYTTVIENGEEKIVSDMTILGVDKTFASVSKAAIRQTVSSARLVWMSLGDIITGKYGLKDLSGPVGTVEIIADAAQASTTSANYSMLINIMAFISINIGVFNLLPIPALDGGRLFFMLIEMVFRKPIPPKYENWVHGAGLIILLAFMAVVTFSDIFKLFQG